MIPAEHNIRRDRFPAAQEDALGQVRIVVRPYASSLPLGAFAFGIGNTLLAAFSFHLIPVSEKTTLAIILLAFVAPLELIPCILAFLSRDSGGAVAMGLFAAGWAVQGLQLLTGDPTAPSVSNALFLFLLSLCLMILTWVTFSVKPVIGILLAVAVLRTLTTGIVQLGVHGVWIGISGALDGMVGALAMYCGAVFLFEDAKCKSLAATFRRGDAKEAMDGSFRQQMKHIANEAGVRQQL